MTTTEATPAAEQGKSKRPLIIVGVVVAVLVLGAAIAVFVLGGDEAGASEIQLEAFDSTGENPFTESVGDGVPVEPAEVPPTEQDATAITGETVGLYGGTEESGRCDPAQLVAFLQQNPDKAAAWAGVHGITPDQIPAFVSGLTPLILRSDTAVTNHGFRDGQAYSLQSVLQAGTAVLVNDKGEPVVKCSCGNPLLPADWSSTYEFVGTPWPDFNQRTIIIIQPAPVTINNFRVYNITTNNITRVPAGSPGIPGTPGTPATPPTTPGAPVTTAPPSLDASYNMTFTPTVCEVNGGACPPANLAYTLTCSAQSCDVSSPNGSNTFVRNGNTLTYSGVENATGFTCDGVPVPTTQTRTLTIDAAGNVSGTFEATAAPVPPNCPAPFRQVTTVTGTRA